MATAARVDPYRNFNFLVEIQGLTVGGFADCSGFGASSEPIEYREGTDRPTVRKLPSMAKYTNIVLKNGLTDSRVLYDWFLDVTRGKVVRRNGSIVVMDLDGVTEKVRWNFVQGWPTKWDGPDFTAKGNDVAVQTFEIAHEGIEQAR